MKWACVLNQEFNFTQRFVFHIGHFNIEPEPMGKVKLKVKVSKSTADKQQLILVWQF